MDRRDVLEFWPQADGRQRGDPLPTRSRGFSGVGTVQQRATPRPGLSATRSGLGRPAQGHQTRPWPKLHFLVLLSPIPILRLNSQHTQSPPPLYRLLFFLFVLSLHRHVPLRIRFDNPPFFPFSLSGRPRQVLPSRFRSLLLLLPPASEPRSRCLCLASFGPPLLSILAVPAVSPQPQQALEFVPP